MNASKNYTDKLKSYWKNNDLTFIATFKKKDEKHGFFINFINPQNRCKIYYPLFHGLEVEDKRISFMYFKVNTLADGLYYKVKLQHTVSPKGKNNPYSLEIESVTALNQEKIKEFLENPANQNSDQPSYIGKYARINDKSFAFTEVMVEENGNILMSNGKMQYVYVSQQAQLIENKYYSFTLSENTQNRKYADLKSITPLDKNPYQEFIRLRFERLDNPEANKMIANLMREIGKGMYSSKQRMIFELLQNADDSPAKDKVEFHIDVNGDYLFLMHDGAPFNKDDVEAITSAAESTKRTDHKKTGYKGIGFKSVFTDSTEVWIKSGGYQFAFQRNNPLFEDFDKFYFSKERYKLYPKLLVEDKEKYKNQKLKFNGSKDIPWQVLPIWQHSLPNEFNDSNFNNFNNPVQFALKLGKNNIEEYLVAVANITNRPQFILFLRNTHKFRLNSPSSPISITKNIEGNTIRISKQYNKLTKQYSYTQKEFSDIPVNDESFKSFGINLVKRWKKNDYDEKIYFFTDLEGREIETIPPKLASADETSLSFGITLQDYSIIAEREYLTDNTKFSSLFTYLPMEDTRFQLPFLVNADFVPSSDRQRIQGDNLWNIYIMIKVAEKHIESLNYYANQFITSNKNYTSYLSLLLKKLIPEDDTAQQIIDRYNETYMAQLQQQPIVVNDCDEIQLASNTILDSSKFTDLFSNELFYEITGTHKKLPHKNLNTEYLYSYQYLKIEKITITEIANKLNDETCKKLGLEISQLDDAQKDSILSWLNELADISPDTFKNIPFIIHGKFLYSIDALAGEPDAWIITRNTKDYESLLKNIGYDTINLNLERFKNIDSYIHTINNYINDKSKAYERIASNSAIANLSVNDKICLINFFSSSDFMSGIGPQRYFKELCLFLDSKGTARPIHELLNFAEIVGIASLDSFKIKYEEYTQLPEFLKRELISRDNVFYNFSLNGKLFHEWSLNFNSSNINQYVSDLESLYGWHNANVEILQSQWSAIPWLYINDTARFIGSEKAYWSTSFSNLLSDNFETIRTILHRANLKTIPHLNCGTLIELFGLKTDSSKIGDWSSTVLLNNLETNTLLDWLELEGNYSDFFSEYYVNVNADGSFSIVKESSKFIVNANEENFINYINNIQSLKSSFTILDRTLCSNSRDKLGLLQGDKLFNAIISTKQYDQKFASFFPQELPFNILKSFIDNLQSFNLNSSQEYASNSPEHAVLYNIIKLIADSEQLQPHVDEVINTLRNKIYINDLPLKHFDLSDKILFGKGDQKYELNLSDVLSEFKGESDILDKVNESFINISSKAKLRRFIFKSRRMEYEEIHAKIESEASPYYSVSQVVFILLAKFFGINKTWSKKHFDTYWKELNKIDVIHQEYQSLLENLYKLNFYTIIDFYFFDFDFKNCVDKNFAIDAEKMPAWLENWINSDEKYKFITQLGYNGKESAIVKLRQLAISDSYDKNEVIKYYQEAKSNELLMWNTLHWLANYNSKKITNNISIITLINNSTSNLNKDINPVVIPTIKAIDVDNSRVYELSKIDNSKTIFFLNESTEFSHEIFDTLSVKDHSMVFIDSTCGEYKNLFQVQSITLTNTVDIETLSAKSSLWNEPYYTKWELNSKYPIYIYEGNEIPYIRKYNDTTINRYTYDLRVKYNDTYYISKLLKKDIFENLPVEFPNEALQSLKDWYIKTNIDPSLLDDDTFEYNETFDRMIQDRYGLSNGNQKDYNEKAKEHALYFLDSLGFNLVYGNFSNSAFYNIRNEEGITVTCIIRSAKGGLLYLDKEHWDMLGNLNTYLVAIYPQNTPRLFRNRFELLNDELSENVLFRMPNLKESDRIDNVFNSLHSGSHLMLVTSQKMKEDLFSKLRTNSHQLLEDDIAIADELIEI